MTPAIDINASSSSANNADLLKTEMSCPTKLHHADTADLLAMTKEAQRLKSLEIMEARELPKVQQQQNPQVVSNVTTPVEKDFHDPYGPFEGPEKLLELWFAEEPADLRQCVWDEQDARPNHFGLRSVPKQVWETMLDIVKCKVLSTIVSSEVDAYLLSESSMFVFPHKLILKTCGTTTLLLGLERLLTIANKVLSSLPRAAKIVDLDSETSSCCSETSNVQERQLGRLAKYAFYSRKSFMFPERQKGPHRDWMLEVAVLDRFFDYGAAYTVGKMNGDHWMLWMGCEGAREAEAPAATIPQIERPLQLPTPCVEDQTLEILMTHLSTTSCKRFQFDPSLAHPTVAECYPDRAGNIDAAKPVSLEKGHALGLALSNQLGLANLFPNSELDAFAFEPCGYSANAVMPRGGKRDNTGYWTIHVTPEEGSSYASFETNVALCGTNSPAQFVDDQLVPSTLPSLVSGIVDVFEPGKMSVTLFVLTSEYEDEQAKVITDSNGDVLHRLNLEGYKRTDRIAYEFERYDLIFVSFEKRCLPKK